MCEEAWIYCRHILVRVHVGSGHRDDPDAVLARRQNCILQNGVFGTVNLEPVVFQDFMEMLVLEIDDQERGINDDKRQRTPQVQLSLDELWGWRVE